MKQRIVYVWAFALLAVFAVACRSSESDAVKTYKTFAKAFMDGKMDKARSLSTGPATQRLQNMVNPPEGQPYIRPFKDTVREVHSTSFKIESETADAEGVSLRMRIEAKIDRPGTHSTAGSATVTFEHTAHLTKLGDEWKVDKFEDRELPP